MIRRIAAPAALVVALSVVLVTSPPATAATAVTPNACDNNLEPGRYRGIDLTWTGTASGTGTVTLSGLQVQAALPDFFPKTGYNTGLGGIGVGANTIPVTAHVALAATNTVEGTKTLTVDLDASFTITDPDGSPGNGDESSTPVQITATLPDVTWTRVDPAQPVSISQAGPGTLPNVGGVGPGGRDVQPDGSAFFVGDIAGLKLLFDCQPGSYSDASYTTFTPTQANAFAVAAADGSEGALPQSPAPGGTGTGSTTTEAPVVSGAGATPSAGTPAASGATGTTGAATQLAQTGPSTTTVIQVIVAVVLLDLGYLLWSATRTARHRAGRAGAG
ncbi:MAG: hypothetical protein AB7L84_09955 [Acidimicrobiia bacterium]